jgi:hypothetical protein
VGSFRRVSAGRGAAWITDAVLGLRRAPGAYLGACLLVAVARSVPLVGVIVGMLMPVFYGGLVSLLRTRAEGGNGRVFQAYDGFAAPGAFARLLPIASFNILFLLGVAALFTAVAGTEFKAVMDSAGTGGEPQPAQVAALMAKLATPMLALLPIAASVGWLMMLAIPRAMLDNVPGTLALREAAAAVWANLGAFVVNLAGLVALFGAGLVASAFALVLVTAMAAAVPALAGLLKILAVFAMIAAFQAVYAAVMFQAAREIFIGADAPPPALDAIEA